MSLGVMCPQSNLMVLYHLENANDSSGNGKNLTNTNVTFETGKYGIAATSDPSNSLYCDTPGIDPSQAHTIMAWVKFNTLPDSSTEYFITLYQNGRKPTLVYFAYSSSFYYLYTSNGAGTARGGAISVIAGKWYHLAVTVGADRTIYVYWNGAQLGTGVGGTTTLNDVTTIFLFKNYSTDHGFLGQADEVCVFAEVKSPQWIRKYYAWATGKMI